MKIGLAPYSVQRVELGVQATVVGSRAIVSLVIAALCLNRCALNRRDIREIRFTGRSPRDRQFHIKLRLSRDVIWTIR